MHPTEKTTTKKTTTEITSLRPDGLYKNPGE